MLKWVFLFFSNWKMFGKIFDFGILCRCLLALCCRRCVSSRSSIVACRSSIDLRVKAGKRFLVFLASPTLFQLAHRRQEVPYDSSPSVSPAKLFQPQLQWHQWTRLHQLVPVPTALRVARHSRRPPQTGRTKTECPSRSVRNNWALQPRGSRRNWLKSPSILLQIAGGFLVSSLTHKVTVSAPLTPELIQMNSSLAPDPKETTFTSGSPPFWVHQDQSMRAECSSWTSISLQNTHLNPLRYGCCLASKVLFNHFKTYFIPRFASCRLPSVLASIIVTLTARSETFQISHRHNQPHDPVNFRA